jgi:hypothetical protein
MGTAAGTVTIGGAAPAEPMRVEFFNPTTGQGAGADVVEAGAYALESPLPAGEYQVFFTPPPAPELTGDTPPPPFKPLTIVPESYTSDANSPLKKTVAEGNNTIDIEIPKK